MRHELLFRLNSMLPEFLSVDSLKVCILKLVLDNIPEESIEFLIPALPIVAFDAMQ